VEAAQNAKAVLGHNPPTIKLRLLRQRPERKRWMPWVLGLLWCTLLFWPGHGARIQEWWSLLAFLSSASSLVYCGYLVLERMLSGPTETEVGSLTTAARQVVLCVDGRETSYALDASLRVILTYQGFRNEHLAPRIRASGIDNFIQLNEGEFYRFEVLTEQAQENLRRELRRWYHLKVKIKEHRRDGLTFLLHRDLSYEQIQAYKQEFGVSLYG
jgi:hypothetical protein